jgi:hypothetical protein
MKKRTKEKMSVETSQVPVMNSTSFQEILKTLLAHDPKEDVDYLTLEQCQEISQKIFGHRTKKTFFIKRVIDKIETSFARGKISKEERDQSIATFNKFTKSNFIRREGSNADEYRYIYKDFWI